MLRDVELTANHFTISAIMHFTDSLTFNFHTYNKNVCVISFVYLIRFIS